MSKIIEKSLIIKKETKFEKMRKQLYRIFFRREYWLDIEFEELLKINRPNINKIIIPKEIKI